MKTDKNKFKEVKRTFKVEIIECERGWGQKIDEVKYFASKEEAEEFCKEYNKDNNKPTVPDWYMYARTA